MSAATPVRFAVAEPKRSATGSAISFVRARWWIIALAIGASLFATFVWPTRYRYDHFQRGSLTILVRIDRFTGQPEYLTYSGWTTAIRFN